jgi:hypothetical protein
MYYCDYPGPRTEHPGVVAGTFGDGRVAYVPGQLGLTYSERGFPDYRRLFAGAIEWLTHGEVPIRTSLPSTVEVTLTRNEAGAHIVHIVNCSTDLSRPVEEVSPVTGATISIDTAGLEVHRAHALVADVELAGEVQDISGRKGMFTAALPALTEHEVIVIE